MHAPVGRGWRSAASLRYVDELPKSLAVDPQQLAPGEDESIQELTPQTSMPPKPEHPQQLRETPESKHPQRLQETPETEHPQQLQETPETEHPQQLQETPKTEHPQQLQETPETDHLQQLQETPETKHPQQLQESLETEHPQQLEETPETEPPQQLETLEEELPHQLGTLEDRGTSSGGQVKALSVLPLGFPGKAIRAMPCFCFVVCTKYMRTVITVKNITNISSRPM